MGNIKQMTPTQRTLKYYRDKGWICEVVERWIPNPKHPGGKAMRWTPRIKVYDDVELANDGMDEAL
jgi:hypothetical protein